MHSKLHIFVLISAICAGFGGPARADYIDAVNVEAVIEVSAIDQFGTTGASMAGMHVTVTRSDGLSESVFWSATGGDRGAAVGFGWELSQRGSTFSRSSANAWDLYRYPGDTWSITSLTIEAYTGGVAFDNILDIGNEHTVGSANGRPLKFDTLHPDYAGGEVATFGNPLSLTGAGPAGDMFGTLHLDLSASPLATLQHLRFWVDTDTFQSVQGQSESVFAVPEPSGTAPALIMALTLLQQRRRRTR